MESATETYRPAARLGKGEKVGQEPTGRTARSGVKANPVGSKAVRGPARLARLRVIPAAALQ